MVWDEDGRLQSVTDNSMQPTTFKYDGDTNRVVKKGAGGETLYINPWYVAALGRNSKQIFAGATRIATKLEISPTGEGYGPGAKNLKEVAQYFYHPDHLGSTGFATDEVWQHLEYFPFGETWVDEVSDDARVPYRFTGKELDQETKLYYYGARYYDPRTSVWENPDRALGKYLNATKTRFNIPSLASGWRSDLAGPGMGGIFGPKNLNGFGYAHQNPLIIIDPDGDASLQEWLAAIRYPFAAPGEYKKGSNNTTTVATRFANQGISEESHPPILSSENEKKSTGEINAMRHVGWIALITAANSPEAAEAIGNAHEGNAPFDSSMVFSTYNAADQAVDFRNNAIGREAGVANSSGSRLDVMKAALETFKNEGFWVANKTEKGFELSRQKLSNEKYEVYKKALEQKDNNANWIKNDQKQ